MIRKNLPFIISYALILLCNLLGAIFYRQSFLAVLLLLCAILPPISIALTKHALLTLRYDAICTIQNLEAGNNVLITFHLNNPSFLPLLNCQIDFTFENLYFPNKTLHTLSLPAEPKRERFFKLPFQTSMAGMFVFTIHTLCITDYLHIYTFSLPFNKEIKIPVLPKELDLTLPAIPKAAAEDEEKITNHQRGTLSSEILQLREYRPGDRLQHIHWKMSAKMDELLVKEFDYSLDLHYLLLPELTGDQVQEMFSVYYTLGRLLLKKGEIFKTAIYHPTDHTFTFLDIIDDESLLQSLYQLYYEPIVNCSSIYEQLCFIYPISAGVVRICGDQLIFDKVGGAL